MSDFAGLSRANPAAVGLDPARVGRIDDVMSRAVKDGQVPAIATVIVRAGQVAHSSVHGVLDLETGAPMPMDGLYRMYSQTKPMAAAVTMALFEEGQFFLDEPITKWLPEFADRRVAVNPLENARVRGGPVSAVDTHPAKREVTIYDLLTMTSGIANMGATPSALWPELAPAWEGSGFGRRRPRKPIQRRGGR